MLLFRGVLPLVNESPYGYLPWAMLSVGLASLIAIQGVVTRKINNYYKKAMSGQNQAGRILAHRRSNAKWNDQVRAYCKTQGLVIVRQDESQHPAESVIENQL